jgi:hypothetical protein
MTINIWGLREYALLTTSTSLVDVEAIMLI